MFVVDYSFEMGLLTWPNTGFLLIWYITRLKETYSIYLIISIKLEKWWTRLIFKLFYELSLPCSQWCFCSSNFYVNICSWFGTLCLLKNASGLDFNNIVNQLKWNRNTHLAYLHTDGLSTTTWKAILK